MMIASLIPNDVKDLLREIEGLGFSLCLVGGGPRDFKKFKILSTDLDFEIRNQEVNELKIFFKNKKMSFTELPYQIIRANVFGMDLEFSPPRVERHIDGNKTHHHFTPELNSSFSYEEAFKRRDFTLNAIGIELDIAHNKEIWIDPYDGLFDLEKGVLREISNDFFLDSVRFLRLIRFCVKYNFTISETIMARLSEFDLSELSVHYFIQEMEKSLNLSAFINKFNELVKLQQLSIPPTFRFLNELKLTFGLKDQEEILVNVFLQKESHAQLVASFFSMPDKKLKRLKSFYASLKKIKFTSKEELRRYISVPISELKDLVLLKELKNLEEKKEWRPYFSEVLPISWSDWESVVVSAPELEAVPVEMRSYLRFYKALKQSFQL